MLPKTYRLQKEADFDRVHKTGRAFRGPFLALKVAPNQLNTTRFGFLVSKKVSKSAVKRGRVRRRLRAIVGAQLEQMHPGYDVVVLVRPAILEKTYEEMETSLTQLLGQARLV